MKHLALILLPILVLIGPLAQSASTFAHVELLPALTLERCEEDMPCWDPADCLTIGNRVCGTADDAGTAWKVWERENGPAKLKVDPSRPHRVDYMASTDTYPENMDTYDLALVGTDGRWYVFRATYTD